ncbi:MAG: hypothetical protein LBK62_03140, partial [Treponema sp.]|nr:hypothetical protein [Treponema sp.]
MEREVITKLLGGLRETAENLPDRRKSSNGRKYEPADFLMSDSYVPMFRVKGNLLCSYVSCQGKSDVFFSFFPDCSWSRNYAVSACRASSSTGTA